MTSTWIAKIRAAATPALVILGVAVLFILIIYLLIRGGAASEPVKITLTAVFGLGVFVLGQVFVKFFAEPVLDFRKVVGEIEGALIFYAPLFTNPPLTGSSGAMQELERDERTAAERALRDLASKLSGGAHVIWFYPIAARLGLVPPRANVLRARAGLIFLSNSTFRVNVERGPKTRDDIQNALGISSDR